MINKTKRMMVSRVVKIPRKTYFWGATPNAGKHQKSGSIALLTVLRDYLKLGDKEREVTRILNNGFVKVDGKIVKDRKAPIGFMDVITIDALNKCYRTLYDVRGNLVVVEDDPKNKDLKLLKISGKTITKGGKIQLSFHDGQSILTEDASLKPGDVVLAKLPEKKIMEVMKLQPGNKAFLTGGSHVGRIATIKKIEVKESSRPNLIHFEEDFSTITNYAFVVGGAKFSFNLPSVGKEAGTVE